MMGDVLVKDYRGNVLENVHPGHICIIDYNGKIKYDVGDNQHITYMRSSAKPLQAIPVIKYGFDKKYGYTDKETTILAASHWGEPFHIAAIESIIAKLNITEDDLIMLPTYPINVKAREALLKANKPARRVYHNCSGKHLGIITLSKGMGYETEGYWEIDHPAQQEILRHVAYMAEYDKDEVKIGVDGCGVPVFAMPLYNLAKAFLRMACPELIKDDEIRMAVIRLTKLMNENSEMIGGTGTICSNLLMDDNIVAKGGAQGVYCFGLKKEKLGIALKVMDGTENNWGIIVASILEQIGYDNKKTISRLYNVFPTDIKNDNNIVVGRKEAVFRI